MSGRDDLVARIEEIVTDAGMPSGTGTAARIVEELERTHALVPNAERDLMVQALWLWGKYNPKANDRCDAIVDVLFADLARDAPAGK